MEANILWADDEIELLKPHILFLEGKGYKVKTVTSGSDAIDELEESDFDLVFLDENMPGLTGLETLERIKEKNASLPVIMITKSEEERIMEEAIGSKIADYLIKPVNPNQILLSIKKNLDSKRLVSEKTNTSYQQEFREIGMRLGDRLDWREWIEMYQKLVYWDLQMDGNSDDSMKEILDMQKSEANQQFSKYINEYYADWIMGVDAPEMSHTILKNKLKPHLDESPVYLVVIDNLRYDQWKILQPILSDFFSTKSEEIYYSILPTATQYARNALFAGLMPSAIEKKFPGLWKNDEDEGGKNLHEREFLEDHLKRMGFSGKMAYHKITNLNAGKKLVDNFANLQNNDLNVIVYNFVDMLSHARTDMEVIRELAEDESAYRSITQSWFEHSPLFDMMKRISELGAKMVITTDHGTVRVTEPSKIIGDRDTSTNLRYKHGRNLSYNEKDVLEARNPEKIGLPKPHLTSTYVFATDTKYFVYPNNYNHYVKLYNETFQHGGISLEEVLIPWVVLEGKG